MRTLLAFLIFCNLSFGANFKKNDDQIMVPHTRPNFISQKQKKIFKENQVHNQIVGLELNANTLKLPFLGKTKIAVFYHAPYWYIVGDWKSKLDLPMLNYRSILSDIKQTHQGVLQISLNDHLYPQIQKKDNTWVITFDKMETKPVYSGAWEFPNQMSMNFSMMGSSDPISFQIGFNNYWVFPTDQEQGNLNFVDKTVPFQIIPSYQGVVILPYSDAVSARVGPDKIIFSYPKPFYSQTDFTKKVPTYATPLFHPIDQWEKRYSEQSRLNKSEDIDVCTKSAFELGWLLLSIDEGQEGKAFLELKRDACAGIDMDTRFQAIKAFADIIMFHPIQEKNKFDYFSKSFKDNNEFMFWEHLNDILLNRWPTTINLDKSMLVAYPKSLREDFVMRILKRSFEKNDRQISKLFLDPELIQPNSKNQDWFDFAEAKHMETAEPENASVSFSKLMKNANDPYIRVLSNYEYFKSALQARQINKDEYIKGLETIKMDWKDSALQYQIIQSMIDFYEKNDRMLDALKEMNFLIDRYSKKANEDHLPTILRDRLFTFLSSSPDPKHILNYIATYHRFKKYLPVDFKDREFVVHPIYKALLHLGLLKEAIGLLTDFIKSFPKVPDIWYGRLARLYMYNNQPDEVIKTISQIAESEKTRIFKAKAYLLKNAPDQALDQMKDYNTLEPLKIKRRALFQLRQWPDLEFILEKLIEIAPPDLLDRYHVDMAICYEMQSKDSSKIRVKYLDRFKDSTLQKEFDLITRLPIKKPGTFNSTEIEDYIQKFDELQTTVQDVLKQP
jgi:tetratricopeptide (TPR) repeat protein